MIRLNLNNDQFAVIYKLLTHVRLGQDNRYSRAISDFMIDAQADFIEDLVAAIGLPDLSVVYSEDEGLVLEMN